MVNVRLSGDGGVGRACRQGVPKGFVSARGDGDVVGNDEHQLADLRGSLCSPEGRCRAAPAGSYGSSSDDLAQPDPTLTPDARAPRPPLWHAIHLLCRRPPGVQTLCPARARVYVCFCLCVFV